MEIVIKNWFLERWAYLFFNNLFYSAHKTWNILKCIWRNNNIKCADLNNKQSSELFYFCGINFKILQELRFIYYNINKKRTTDKF